MNFHTKIYSIIHICTYPGLRRESYLKGHRNKGALPSEHISGVDATGPTTGGREDTAHHDAESQCPALVFPNNPNTTFPALDTISSAPDITLLAPGTTHTAHDKIPSSSNTTSTMPHAHAHAHAHNMTYPDFLFLHDISFFNINPTKN